MMVKFKKFYNSLSSEVRSALIAGVVGLFSGIISVSASTWISSMEISADREKYSAEDRVARAQLFKDLIEDLGKPETANYALLALWQLYDQPKERKIILVAALQNPGVKTIQMLPSLGLADELSSHLSQIEQLLKQGTIASESARQLLIDVAPEKYVSFLVRELQSSRQTDFSDRRVTDLSTVIREKGIDSKNVVELLDEKNANYFHVLFALYLAGTPEPLRDQIKNIPDNPVKALSRLSVVAKNKEWTLAPEDWAKIEAAARNLLKHRAREDANSGSNEQKLATATAIELLTRPQFDASALSAPDQTDLLESLHHHFALSAADAFQQAPIMRLIVRMDKTKAIALYAKSRACEFGSDTLEVLVADLAEARRTHGDFPKKSAEPNSWKDWISKNNNGSSKCEV